MKVHCGPGTTLLGPLVLVWNSKECENSEFKLGLAVIIQVEQSSRMREHILYNNLLAGFITFKYLDMWSMGLHVLLP